MGKNSMTMKILHPSSISLSNIEMITTRLTVHPLAGWIWACQYRYMRGRWREGEGLQCTGDEEEAHHSRSHSHSLRRCSYHHWKSCPGHQGCQMSAGSWRCSCWNKGEAPSLVEGKKQNYVFYHDVLLKQTGWYGFSIVAKYSSQTCIPNCLNNTPMQKLYTDVSSHQITTHYTSVYPSTSHNSHKVQPSNISIRFRVLGYHWAKCGKLGM